MYVNNLLYEVDKLLIFCSPNMIKISLKNGLIPRIRAQNTHYTYTTHGLFVLRRISSIHTASKYYITNLMFYVIMSFI